jgi:hypothetical protein
VVDHLVQNQVVGTFNRKSPTNLILIRPPSTEADLRFRAHPTMRPSERRVYTLAMTVCVDSVEYKCWHEVGHATVCLHLGGDIDFIEFLDGDARGDARTRCVIMPGTERSVACGGFATEFYLLKNGYAEQAPGDKRDIGLIPYDSAVIDCLDFWGRKLETYKEGADSTACRARIPRDVGPLFHGVPGHRSTASRAG